MVSGESTIFPGERQALEMAKNGKNWQILLALCEQNASRGNRRVLRIRADKALL